MEIKKMFKDDIDRTINGVVQVEQEKKMLLNRKLKNML